MKIWATD